MGRKYDFEKWKQLYFDKKEGLTWQEIVKKNHTSKQTISRAIRFYRTLENGNSQDIEKMRKKFRLPREKILKIQDDIQHNKVMKNLYELKEIENKQDQNIAKTLNIIKMLESMNQLTRIRLILILLIYNELSLSDLSRKLGVSKSTASRHLKALISTNLIIVQKQENRSGKSQYYSIVPNLLEVVRLGSSELKRIPSEKAFTAKLLDMQTDRLTFKVIKSIMNEILLYYEDLGNHISSYPPITHQEINNTFSTENLCRYYLWMFNEEQFEYFKTKYLVFLRDILNEMERYHPKDGRKQEINPYFVWHMIAPLKKIYDRIIPFKI